MIEIYADGLVLINFIVDYILLCTLEKISGRKKDGKRLFLSALFGGISSLIIFLPSKYFIFQFVLKIASSVLMILIANEFVSKKQFLKELFYFLFLSCIFGGFVFLVYVLFPRKNFLVSPFAIYFHISPIFLIFSFILTYFCVCIFKLFTENAFIKAGNYKVTVSVFGKKKEFNGFLDTGNLLKDPLSGAPVVVAALEDARDIIPIELKNVIENKQDAPDEILKIPDKIKKSFRLIPYNTIDKSGMLPSIKVDFLEIESEKSFSIIPTAYLAITEKNLGIKENNIILNPTLLKLSQNKNYI